MQIKILTSLQPWCLTDKNGEYRGEGAGERESKWGYCGSGCPIEADAWYTDDNSFIVKYSDEETWKITAILTCISMISFLLISGLFATLIIIVFGKLILKNWSN